MSGNRRTYDYTLARAKVEAEGQCRACSASGVKLEAAHTVGKAFDIDAEVLEVALLDALRRPYGDPTYYPPRRGRGRLMVHPGLIVPLCGPPTTSSTCHALYDDHALDLTPYMTAAEQALATFVVDGIAPAYRRLTGGKLDPPAAEPGVSMPWD